MNITVKFNVNDRGSAPTKLADAEIHFGDDCGIFAGLKLIGFSVWARRTGGGLNVTFPARQYRVNGEARSFALLRPAGIDFDAQSRIRDYIIQAWRDFEDAQGTTQTQG